MSDKTQQVRDRAYQIWQQQGEPEGCHTDHWLQAEQELNEGVSASANEGEGSQTGARNYNETATAFAHSDKVTAAADEAVKALDDPAETAKMRAAEEVGKQRSRGEDPALTA